MYANIHIRICIENYMRHTRDICIGNRMNASAFRRLGTSDVLIVSKAFKTSRVAINHEIHEQFM